MTRSPAARIWSVVRLVMAAVLLAAICAQLSRSVGTAIEFERDVATIVANFFSFFTILSNVSAVVVLGWAGFRHLMRRRAVSDEPAGLSVTLACVTTYMLTTGIVYNALLRTVELPQGSQPIPWSNEVLHLIGPLFLLADLFVGPLRQSLPWRALWAIAAFPVLWVAYTLVRGPFISNPITGDSFWYPYPFLNPNNPGGWPSVGLFVVGIAAAIVGVAALVVWWHRRSTRRSALRPPRW